MSEVEEAVLVHIRFRNVEVRANERDEEGVKDVVQQLRDDLPALPYFTLAHSSLGMLVGWAEILELR